MTGTNLQGTTILSTIVPVTSTDTYATHDSLYGKGGWREVNTLAERDAIPEERRREGMVVYVSQNSIAYILKIFNKKWQWVPIPENSEIIRIIDNAIKNGQIDIDLSDYATKEELADYVTKNELDKKGYLTEIPIASKKILGGVKVDGTTVIISSDGVISAKLADGGNKNYDNLYNKPQINSIELIGNKTLEQLGIQPAGDYALKEDVPDKISMLTNDIGYITAEVDDLLNYTKTVDLAPVALTGEYHDLKNIPDEYVLPVASTDVLGGVKIDGNTIIIKDGIISAVVSSNYEFLDNKPQINSVELSGNKSLSDLGIQPEGDYPTKTEMIEKVDEARSVWSSIQDRLM